MEVPSPGKVATSQQPTGQAAPGFVRRPRWERPIRGFGRRVSRLPLSTATWLGSFLVLTATLLVRNAYLFSTKIYENLDFAANTIAVLQAKHFHLLTGNYSKEGFYHPGPAFLYAMAAGESFFHDLLHAVPTPWNGQLLAILLLNAALLATSLMVIARHAGSVPVTLACLVVVLVLVAVHPLAVNSEWMPYVYFTPALLLLVSGASVGTGQTTDLPFLALGGWLCINGQAEFLFFVPICVLVSLAGLIAAHRRDLPGLFRGRGRDWAGALAVTAVLAGPIAAYTLLHWPGQFGHYLAYARTAPNRIHHTLAVSVAYTLRFWWPGIPVSSADVGGFYVGLILGILALAVTLRCPLPRLRRFLAWSLVMAGLMTVLFIYYAQRSIVDKDLTQAYLGYFYWAAPLLVAMVAAAGAAAYLDHHRGAVLALAAVVTAAAVVAAVVPQHRDNPGDPPARYLGVPQIPHADQVLAAQARGRPIVLRIGLHDWPDTVGIVAYADRVGQRTCVVGRKMWAVLFRAQSICTSSEIRTGVSLWVWPTDQRRPPGYTVVAALPQTVVTVRTETSR